MIIFAYILVTVALECVLIRMHILPYHWALAFQCVCMLALVPVYALCSKLWALTHASPSVQDTPT